MISFAKIMREGEEADERARVKAEHVSFVGRSFARWGASHNADFYGWDRAIRLAAPELFDNPRTRVPAGTDEIPMSVRSAAISGYWSQSAITASWDRALAPFAATEEELAFFKPRQDDFSAAMTEIETSALDAVETDDPSPERIAGSWDQALESFAANEKNPEKPFPQPLRPPRRRRYWPNRRK